MNSICILGDDETVKNDFISFMKNGLNAISKLKFDDDEQTSRDICTTSPNEYTKSIRKSFREYKILLRQSISNEKRFLHKVDICILIFSANEYKSFLNDHLHKYLSFIRSEKIKKLVICYNHMDKFSWTFKQHHEIVCDISKKLQRYNFDKTVICPISVKYGSNIFEKLTIPWMKTSLYNILENFSIQNIEYCAECFYGKK